MDTVYPVFANEGPDPRMLFVGELTTELDQQCLHADQVQVAMVQFHKHL